SDAARHRDREQPEWKPASGQSLRARARGSPIAARARNGPRGRGKTPRGWGAGGRSQNPPSSGSPARIRLSRALLGETVEQRPIDLVARRERQFIDEPDEARMRVSGCVGKREALDLALARTASRLRHHESDRLLPLDVVVDRDDGGL